MSGENLNLSALSKEIFRQAQMIGYLNAFHLFGLKRDYLFRYAFFIPQSKKAYQLTHAKIKNQTLLLP